MSDIGLAKDQLRSIIERVERVNEEIKELNIDKKDIFGEAKANGFDSKVLKQIVKIRSQDLSERIEQETIRDLYMHALGMLPETGGDVGESEIGTKVATRTPAQVAAE